MISDNNVLEEEDSPFRRPQVLEQLRQQLEIISSKDHQSLQIIIRELHSNILQIHSSPQNLSSSNQNAPVQSIIPFINQLQYQTKERSSNISILITLIFKLLDFIQEEQMRIRNLSDHYQTALETLKNQNDFLAYKNIALENQLQYVRQHLGAVELQLQQIKENSINYYDKQPTKSQKGEHLNDFQKQKNHSQKFQIEPYIMDGKLKQIKNKSYIKSQASLFHKGSQLLHISQSQQSLAAKGQSQYCLQCQRQLLFYQREIEYLTNETNALKRQLENRDMENHYGQISIDKDCSWDMKNVLRQQNAYEFNPQIMRNQQKQKQALNFIQRIASAKSIREQYQPISDQIMPFKLIKDKNKDIYQHTSPIFFLKRNTLSNEYSQKSLQFINSPSSSNIFVSHNNHEIYEQQDEIKLFEKESKVYLHTYDHYCNNEIQQRENNNKDLSQNYNTKETQQSLKAILLQNTIQSNKKQYQDFGINTQQEPNYQPPFQEKIQQQLSVSLIKQNLNKNICFNEIIPQKTILPVSNKLKQKCQNKKNPIKSLIFLKHVIISLFLLIFSSIFYKKNQKGKQLQDQKKRKW